MRSVFLWKSNMPRFRTLLLPLLWGLSCAVFAQVYKSTDAEGNVVFSDTPAEGGEEVKIPEANVADPVEVPEYVPPAPEPQVVEQQPPVEVIVGEDKSDSGGSNRRRWRHRKSHHR